MKRSLTIPRLAVIGILVLLAVGYAAGAAYLNSSGFRLKLLIAANAAMDGRLTIESHYLALHGPRLELSGVRLTDAKGKPLATIQRVHMKLSWTALLRRMIHVKTLDVQDARFHLRYDLDDRLQMVKAVGPSRPTEKDRKNKKMWSWRIDDFRLNGGAATFERPAKEWSGRMDDVTITASADSTQPHGRVHMNTGPLRWQQAKTVFDLPSLDISADVDASQWVTVAVGTPKSTLKARGRLNRKPAEPLLDAACDLDVDPAEFHAWLPETTVFKDRISAQITAKGRLDDPSVTIRAALTQGEVMGVPIAQLEADLRMDHRDVTIKALRSRSDWGEVDLTGHVDLRSVFGGLLKFDTAQWDNVSYTLELAGKDLQPDRMGLFHFPPGGRFQLRADITGKGLADPAAQGSANIDLQAAGLALRKGAPGASGRLSVALQRKGADIELSKLQAAVDGNDLGATARINISSGHIGQAEARLQSARLDELGALLGIQLPSGTGKINIRCQGPFQQPTAQIDLMAQEMAMGKHPLGRLLAQARLDKQGVVNISRMVLENQGSLVEGSGRLTLFQAEGAVRTDPGVDLDLAFQTLAPADFGLAEWAGTSVNGRMTLGGSIQHLTGQAELEESTVRWKEFTGRVKANAGWNDGRLTVPDLTLFKETSSVHLNGSATWRRTGDDQWLAEPLIEAQILGRQIRLGEFFPDHSGNLEFDGQVSGPASDLNGQFQLSGADLDIGGQPFKSLALEGRTSEGKIYWDTLALAFEDGRQITSQGWYALDRRFSLRLAAEDIALNKVAALQRAYPIDGRLGLDMKATGTLKDPQMNAVLVVREPRLNNQPWDDFHMTAVLGERRLKLVADLNFNLSADYQLDNGDFDLQGNFDQSDLSPYLALWGGADWAGKLSGRLRAKGNRRQPNQIQSELALSDIALNYQNQPIITAPKLNASLKNGNLDLPETRLTLLNNGFVILRATGRLPDGLQVASDGRLPMAALAPFVDALNNPSGELAFQASAQGPLDKIQWQTKVDLNGTGFEIPGLAQQVESLQGHLEITTGSLVVEDLSGRLDGGRFTLNGKMALKEWRPVKGRLTLNAHALPLQWPDTMDVVVSGDLAFNGAVDTPALTGQLVLLEGSYYKDVKLNLLSAVTQTKRAVPVSSTYSVPGQLGRTSLNVAVTHRYPLLVDNNLANLQVAPDLKIIGTLDRPILGGRAQVTEGEVIFRRKSFEVKRGVVDFINPYKIEPNLDIVAEADIRQWQVSLSLSGPPDQLVFKLSSEPAESENDILSLILLGRTGSELAKGEGGSNQTTRQMLASLVATAWGEDVKKQTGVDILEVETGAGDDAQSADRVQLTVGKKLSRRLTVKYEVESGKEELVQRAISEYRFLEHLLASGFQDSKGGYGGELVFRIEF